MKKKGTKLAHPESLNLHKFIRLVKGDSVPDYVIAGQWHIDPKNFHEFKIGNYPVPRLEKLAELATILRVNKHLVFQVALGTPAAKVFEMIKSRNRAAQLRLIKL
jgi:hypothetical protein